MVRVNYYVDDTADVGWYFKNGKGFSLDLEVWDRPSWEWILAVGVLIVVVGFLAWNSRTVQGIEDVEVMRSVMDIA